VKLMPMMAENKPMIFMILWSFDLPHSE